MRTTFALFEHQRKTVIPRGQVINVACTANTGPESTTMPVLFEPDEKSQWPTGLQIYKTRKTVKKGSVPRIDIEVHSTSQHDTVLPNHTPLGKLQLIKSVTPMEVKLAYPNYDKGLGTQGTDDLPTSTGVRDEELWQESFISMPEVDINGWLDNGTAGDSPKNGCREGSIFCKELEGLQMNIDLSDSIPLQWNYVSYYPKTPLPRNEELHQGPNEQTVHHQIAVILSPVVCIIGN